jgi:hypothetical protein
MAEQNLRNHRKFAPAFHFVALPLLVVAVFLAQNPFQDDPSTATALPLLTVVLIGITLIQSRTFALGVQDRVIRLEEQLRLERVLPEDLRAPARGLDAKQLIGLRFASDRELPDLVRRVLSGELATQKSIKQAVTEWRADHQRV